MTCDDFQIAIERELHGALPEPERAPLAAHLSTCEACRAYQAAARGTERAMATNAGEAMREVDWITVERGIREGIWSALRGVVAAVLGGAFMAALIWLTASPAFRAERMLRVGGALGIAMALVALVMGLAAWRLVRLERGAEMLEHYRQGVRAKVRFGRWMHWVLFTIAGVFAWRGLTEGSARVNGAVFYGVLALTMAGVGLYNRLVKLPRALREQAELDPERKA